MQHANYWSCSSFADWLRGTAKPGAETMEGWDVWKKDAKKKHPFRFWLADDGLGKLQDIVYYPSEILSRVRYYYNNRFVSKTHYMKTGLEPGQWHEFETRLMHGMFNELVEFVEIECAWMNVVWDKEAAKQFNRPWWRKWYRAWRSPESGLAYFEWSSKLVYDENSGIEKGHKLYGKPTPQAIAAKETIELYNWWKNVYPNRPDVYDVTGWSAHCDSKESIFVQEKTAAGKKKVKKMLADIRNTLFGCIAHSWLMVYKNCFVL